MTDSDTSAGETVRLGDNAQVSGDVFTGGKQVGVEVGAISNISGGQVNVAGGHIIHAEAGATVIIGGADQAGNVFRTLNDLIDVSPEVRAAVGEFQANFSEASTQVDILGDYKDLHDLLHDLQFSCFNAIVKDARSFPEDELGLESLQEYRFNLENLLAKFRAVLQRGLVAKVEGVWVQEITQAHTDLQAALDQLDKQLLDKTTWRLNRLLTTQPSRINTRLVDAARTLRLPLLVEALGTVGKSLPELKVEVERITLFQAGLAALANLSGRLQTQVEDHEQWQAVEVELRRVGALIEKDLFELQMSWPDLRAQAERLYASSSEEWAVSLQKDSVALDEVLNGDNPLRTRTAFRSYSRRVSTRFYQVDLNLKTLCGELRYIADPLSKVLRKIE